MAGNSVICQLADAEGKLAGNPVDIPQDAGPRELTALLNAILNNEERLPYAFYIDDREVSEPLGEHLRQHKGASPPFPPSPCFSALASPRLRPLASPPSPLRPRLSALASLPLPLRASVPLPLRPCLSALASPPLPLRASVPARPSRPGLPLDPRLSDHITIVSAANSFILLSVEKVLSIVYQPQAVFRIRSVTRCSATIPGPFSSPSLLFKSPSLLFKSPSLLFKSPSLLFKSPSLLFKSPSLLFKSPSLLFKSPSLLFKSPSLLFKSPSLLFKSPSLLFKYSGHTEAVLAVAFSPDSKQLASGSGDTTVRFWDVDTQTPLKTRAGHKNWVLSLAWSPDAKWLATGGMDAHVLLWESPAGEKDPVALKVREEGSGGQGGGWAGFGFVTAAVAEGAWSPDAKWLATGGMDAHVLLWESPAGEKDPVALKGHRKWITAIAWEAGHRKWITAIAWEPAHVALPCRRLASASRDGDVRVWDAVRRATLFILTGHTLAVTSLRWGGDGVIYSGSRDCTVRMWSAVNGAALQQLKGHGHWVNSLALSTDYALRTGAFDHGGVNGLPATDEERKEKARVRYEAVKGASGERLVSGSDDFTMVLWHPAAAMQPNSPLAAALKAKLTGHQQLVNHVCFSPDGRWLASGSFDKSVKLWDGVSGRFIASFRAHVSPIYQLCWSADSRLLVSASKDSTLKVWDLQTRKVREDLPGHADEVFAVDWSPDGTKVASGGKDRVLKLWMT
ncbi:unnamed protein product [Closterium sp. NIES-64]|nr:unnamed protein product [Closterium sp. NIES-64]